MWGYMPIILIGKLRQEEDQKFKASLGYIERLCSKKHPQEE
jgi:hypothetical protein